MTIGFNITRFNFGGGERIQLMLMNEFSKLGHRIIIFSLDDNIPNEFKIPCELITIKRRKNKFLHFLYEFYKVHKELGSRKIDCLIIFGLAESFVFSAYLTNTSSIVSLRVDPRFKKSQRFFRIRYPISFALSSGIVFQTQLVKQYFKRKVQSKSTVIHNPIIEDFLVPPLIIRKKRIVAVGRLSTEKNYPMLIKAFSSIESKDFTLHIYGEGELKNDLEDLIKRYGMQSRIILEGYVEDIMNKLVEAEIYVLCSDSEGMPNALIEAMAMGLACISTNFPSGGASEIIQDYVNGILVPIRNQEELEKALVLLINNKELCRKLGNNAININNALKRDRIIEEWIRYIEHVENKNRSLC